jgi:hypothetical protein
MFDKREKPPLGMAAFPECLQLAALTLRKLIALALAASHWRTAALFLHAKCAEAGDYLSLDLNRRRAR